MAKGDLIETYWDVKSNKGLQGLLELGFNRNILGCKDFL